MSTKSPARTSAVVAGPRRRGRAPGTSLDEIASIALRIADRDGLDSLTMQRLADAVGVGTMTLYGYFRSKDELLDAIVDAAVTGGPPVPRSPSWREELRVVVTAVHANLGRHPSLVEIRFRRPLLQPKGLRFAERCFSVLLGAGFPPEDAARAFRLLFTHVFGYAGLSPQRHTDAVCRTAADAMRTLPPERYPAITAHIQECATAMAGPEPFDYGLQRILDGLEFHLTRLKPTAASPKSKSTSILK